MSCICVIPARGGSKRIPRKNIRDFAGKPIIAWSIETALASRLFDDVLVSTDDDEIAQIAERYGARVPFRRPPELANDHAGTMEVVQHTLAWLDEAGAQVTTLCCLYAAAPFVTVDYLKEGMRLLGQPSCNYAFPVCSYGHPVQRALSRTQSGMIEARWPEYRGTRSQDLEELVHDTGQFYFGRAESWRRGEPIFADHSFGIQVKRSEVQDIDTEDDWRRAEWIWRAQRAGS